MSGLVELDQAARLHRAEDRWLDHCADRLRKAARPQGPIAQPVTPADTTTKETLR